MPTADLLVGIETMAETKVARCQFGPIVSLFLLFLVYQVQVTILVSAAAAAFASIGETLMMKGNAESLTMLDRKRSKYTFSKTID